MNYITYKLNPKKLLIGLFLIVLPMACDGGGDNNNGGGNNNEPFVSACDGFVVTITGTEGNDNLVGTEGNDVIRGLGGSDTINGLGGNDRICGDRGNDNLLGGNGIDILDGGPDDDIVDGQSGDDIIVQAPGSHDVLVGPAFNPQGPQSLDEVSFTDAISDIFMNITSNQNQVVNEDRDTVRLDGFFPNIYGSFHPDSFFFSNQFHNGAVGHVFDPIQGGHDILIIDAAGMPISVIKETSFFDGALGPLQGDTTILLGNTLLNTVDIEKTAVHNSLPRIIDDGDEGYDAPGFTRQAVGGQGFNGDIEFSFNEGNTATWIFSDVPDIAFLVSSTWDSDEGRATDAPYTITSGPNTRTVEVNQEQAPDHFMADEELWRELTIIKVENNTLIVKLKDDANGAVIADAVRIDPMKIKDELLVDDIRGLPPGGGSVTFDPDEVGVVLEVGDGIAEAYSLIDANVSTNIEFPGATNNELGKLMLESNTDMFLVTTTYPPRPDVSNQLLFMLNINGNVFETVFDQTQAGTSFTEAPLGQNAFKNLFVCILPDDDNNPLTPPKVTLFNGQFSSLTGTQYIWDALAVVPINRLEFPFFGLVDEDLDFDGDQMCVILP